MEIPYQHKTKIVFKNIAISLENGRQSWFPTDTFSLISINYSLLWHLGKSTEAVLHYLHVQNITCNNPTIFYIIDFWKQNHDFSMKVNPTQYYLSNKARQHTWMFSTLSILHTWNSFLNIKWRKSEFCFLWVFIRINFAKCL